MWPWECCTTSLRGKRGEELTVCALCCLASLCLQAPWLHRPGPSDDRLGQTQEITSCSAGTRTRIFCFSDQPFFPIPGAQGDSREQEKRRWGAKSGRSVVPPARLRTESTLRIVWQVILHCNSSGTGGPPCLTFPGSPRTPATPVQNRNEVGRKKTPRRRAVSHWHSLGAWSPCVQRA